jgi:DNA-binding response OmpR family regulator
MGDAKQKILIVEDDLDVANLLNGFFIAQGYEVIVANKGEDGVWKSQNSHPDIVILDIRLPDIDGYEVARRLRNNRRTADIPIIFLSERRALSERLRGLELGADDYIPKPFDVQELKLRIRNTLRRAEQDTLTNTVTGLPEGRLVDERMSEYLNKDGWSMLIVSLENLDIFRESYGFVASDDVIRAVGLMVRNTLKELGEQEDFIGHLSPTDLVLISETEQSAALQENINNRLDQSLDYFYPIKDRENHAARRNSLFVRTGLLKASDGNFGSLNELKISLLRKKSQEGR